ncbi:MAG TPA: HNH endonuclease [Devosia sp.]|nr:HNH endonuclease [Devosia sp.]
MSNKKAQKQRLYAQGVAAAKAIGIEPALFICPLCLLGYGEEALDDGTMTLEHVPPASLGGKGIILTCRTCNSTTGHALESHSHLRAKQSNFISKLVGQEPGYGGRGVATFGEAQVNVELLRKNDAITFKVGKNNSPEAIAASQEFLHKAIGDGWKGLKFQVTSLDAFHPRRARVADLKAAFLTLTAAFGYTFAMNELLGPVREQIAAPESHILPNWWGSVDMPPLSIGIVEQEGLAVVALPSGGVMLPWPSRNYNRWTNSVAGGRKSMTARGWPWPKNFEAHFDHQN